MVFSLHFQVNCSESPRQSQSMEILKNVLIAALVPLPSVAFYISFLKLYHSCSSHSPLQQLWNWCFHHPIFLANILFFFNVDVLCWVIAIIQSSLWLIDLYWTVVPVMLVHYYYSHPMAKSNTARSAVVVLLTWIWSIRISHNYLRRERWQLGAREDWRFADLRKKHGKDWWWVSFFAAYLVQQVFLIGICLPMYAIHFSENPWNGWDTLAMIVCISGIVTAYFADTQLFNFTESNRMLKKIGVSTVPCLDKGLWRYSRHPNYFGEQLWWWGLVIFGWNVGQGWTFIGSLINSICLGYVTFLVEQRMLKQENRTEAYRLYQKTTSVWIPWFKSTPRGEEKKNSD